MTFNLSVILLFLLFASVQLEPLAVDHNGYVAYCGCMGRFGNQADHFLGTLAFANAVNRTLILPPWVEYRKGESKSIQVKFDKYFKVQPLSEFTRVITMEEFMEHLAPTVWPEDKRISFCYTERIGLDGRSTQSCNAKDGNPFFSFWDHFQIDFTGSEFYGPNMNYDIHHRNMGEQWQKKYNGEEWSVIAFTGAPATFPVQKENRHLHKYLQWSDDIDKAADEFIKTVLPKGAFIGIHLRNGMDWIRACDHVKDTKNLFASPQCLGYNGEKGALSMEICLPGKDIIVRKIKRLIKKVKDTTVTNQIRSIFVASDNNHMIEGLNESLRRMNIKAYKLNDNNPHVDLAILGRSNFFIGNCVSSYSSFVKRERDVRGFPSEFWGYPIEKSQKGTAATSKQHEEL